MSGPHATIAHMRPLQKGWEWVPLGKYVENHDGRRIPISKKERESRSGLFPYYGASGVIDTIDGFTHDGEFLLIGEDGANLLTRSKPLAFLTKGKVWVNNHAHVLRCKPGYSNAYLAYFINSIDLAQYVTGTAQPKLSQSMMNKILIPVAPPEQQVEIVAELEKQFSRLDEAVANLQRVKANLKHYKASILKDAVEGRLVPLETELARREGRSFETGDQLLQRVLGDRQEHWNGRGKYKVPYGITDLELPKLPDGWTWISVDALAFVTKLAGFEYTKFVRYDDSGDLAVIKAENASHEGFRRTKFSKVKSESVRILTRSKLTAGDLLMVFVGAGTGKVACVPDDQPYFLGPNISMIRVDQKHAFPQYIEYYLRSPQGHSLTLSFMKAVAQPSLSMGTIRCIPIALPPRAEQERIASEIDRRMSLVFSVEAEVNANLKRAQSLRHATLKKAFTA